MQRLRTSSVVILFLTLLAFSQVMAQTDTYFFKYTYGNGDYYTGRFYQDPADTSYYPGLVIQRQNETGAIGSYLITDAGITGNPNCYGQVFVDWYYDGDQTKHLFRPVDYFRALGTNGLGSETGWIKNAHVPDYLFGHNSLMEEGLLSLGGNGREHHLLEWGRYNHPAPGTLDSPNSYRL